MTERFSIDALGEKVAAALSVDYSGSKNGQIRSIPDRRTIRYYTTLGLVDRPAEMRGRTALYGPRHVLQLVAIKRLQAQGLSLTNVQKRLAGASDKQLSDIARLPDNLEALAQASSKPEPSPSRREDFWRTPETIADAAQAHESQHTQANQPGLLSGLPLDEAGLLTLLFKPARPITQEDLLALQESAAGLLNELRSRGLLHHPTPKPRG